jgi:hemerythrin-like domain-containing protein
MHGFSSAAFSRIGEAIGFIDTEIRRHCEKEEQFLMPLIENHIPDSREIRGEHRALWTAFRELRRHIQDIEDGRLRGTAIIDLVHSAHMIAEILGDHIARENDELFPMVKRLLNADEYDRLTRGIVSATN